MSEPYFARRLKTKVSFIKIQLVSELQTMRAKRGQSSVTIKVESAIGQTRLLQSRIKRERRIANKLITVQIRR